MLIVLSEDSPQNKRSEASDLIHQATEGARLADCRVFYIPADFADCDGAENALSHIAPMVYETPGVWLGFIPDLPRYQELYNAALRRNVRLLNTPEEHARIMEFDRFYPLLGDLTPRSVIVTAQTECDLVEEELGFPIFIKGAVKSRKELGWDACIARNREELERMCQETLRRDYTARNKMVAREVVALRHAQCAPNGFPMGREFRVFLYMGDVLGLGYYWRSADPLAGLDLYEEQCVRELAQEAARRIGTPFAVVDIGQTVDRRWLVIETGDPQCSGVAHVRATEFWHRLKERLGLRSQAY